MTDRSVPLLSVSSLSVRFRLPEGILTACEDVSFSVERGESLGIVGESGSGKSVTVLSIMDLVSAPSVRREGSLTFRGEPCASLAAFRGRDVSMVFQNPLNSLNPSIRIGRQLGEVLEEHLGMPGPSARDRVVGMMERLAIPDPERMLERYPFEFSGGMRQRVMIAMAMLCEPALLVADEPTTALDVISQAQILHLFRELQRMSGTALIFITHDLGVVSQIAQRIMVMYAGRVMEIAPVADIFANPLHPYTVGLLRSIPTLGAERRGCPLAAIRGNVPSPLFPPPGCRFHPRCDAVMDVCRTQQPPPRDFGGRVVWCWKYRGEGA